MTTNRQGGEVTESLYMVTFSESELIEVRYALDHSGAPESLYARLDAATFGSAPVPRPGAEPSDAQVLAAAIALTGGSAILFAELDTETQDSHLEDAHAALIAAGGVR